MAAYNLSANSTVNEKRLGAAGACEALAGLLTVHGDVDIAVASQVS
jgi:hypothetical protein